MKILIFSWRGPMSPNAGGAEESTHQHAKGWVDAGHSVTLFTSEFKGAKQEDNLDGVRIIRRGSQNLGVHLAAFQWYLFENDQKYNLVIDQFHGIPFFTPLYVRVKKMAFIHEVTKEVWKLNPWPKPFNLIPAYLGYLFEPLIFNLFYSKIPFMTVSKSTKEDLIRWGINENNIFVVENGIKKPKQKKLPKEIKPTVVFLGALSRDKGIEDALHIFKLLNNYQKDWQFWVIGKGEDRYLKYLENLATQLDIKQKIKFWGFVSDDKKYELLARSHILINPSVREGWGLVVIEAAAVGTPTVGYDVAGLRDSILEKETGYLCNPTPEDCSMKILELINNKERYNILRKNCLNWSSRFRWDKSSKESLTLITKITTQN